MIDPIRMGTFVVTDLRGFTRCPKQKSTPPNTWKNMRTLNKIRISSYVGFVRGHSIRTPFFPSHLESIKPQERSKRQGKSNPIRIVNT